MLHPSHINPPPPPLPFSSQGVVFYLTNTPSQPTLSPIQTLALSTPPLTPPPFLSLSSQGVVLRFTRDTKRPVVRFSEGIERVVMNEVFTVVSAGKVVAQVTPPSPSPSPLSYPYI